MAVVLRDWIARAFIIDDLRAANFTKYEGAQCHLRSAEYISSLVQYSADAKLLGDRESGSGVSEDVGVAARAAVIEVVCKDEENMVGSLVDFCQRILKPSVGVELLSALVTSSSIRWMCLGASVLRQALDGLLGPNGVNNNGNVGALVVLKGFLVASNPSAADGTLATEVVEDVGNIKDGALQRLLVSHSALLMASTASTRDTTNWSASRPATPSLTNGVQRLAQELGLDSAGGHHSGGGDDSGGGGRLGHSIQPGPLLLTLRTAQPRVVAAALATLAANEGWRSREVLSLLVADLDPTATIHAQLSRYFMEQRVQLAIEGHSLAPAGSSKDCRHGAVGGEVGDKDGAEVAGEVAVESEEMVISAMVLQLATQYVHDLQSKNSGGRGDGSSVSAGWAFDILSHLTSVDLALSDTHFQTLLKLASLIQVPSMYDSARLMELTDLPR